MQENKPGRLWNPSLMTIESRIDQGDALTVVPDGTCLIGSDPITFEAAQRYLIAWAEKTGAR